MTLFDIWLISGSDVVNKEPYYLYYINKHSK